MNEECVTLYSWGSGSSGNCYYLKYGKEGLLIDAGVSIRNLKKYFNDYGLPLCNISGILVSHSHTDHVKSVGAIALAHNIPVYTTKETFEGMDRNYLMTKKVPLRLQNKVVHNQMFHIGPFQIISFPVPHDSNDNNGFLIKWNNESLCFVTDMGSITSAIINHVKLANHLIIEANYDENMLENGPYPEFLKRRINGGRGHISNRMTAEIIDKNSSDNIKNIWLCHLSEENNRPELAEETIKTICQKSFNKKNKEVQVVSLRRKSPHVFEIK